jgi:hypothetical protein
MAGGVQLEYRRFLGDSLQPIGFSNGYGQVKNRPKIKTQSFGKTLDRF